MMIGVDTLSSAAKAAAQRAGFELAGVATLEDPNFPELARFPEWVERGHAGEMEYLKARDDQGRLKRASVRVAAPWARSVIVCARSYDSPQPLSTECNDSDRGWISRYAWMHEDYHHAILRRLREVEADLVKTAAGAGLEPPRTWCYVDTGPIVERVYAKYAGIGWIGKNTCIIHEQRGSFVFLGVILTSLDLAPDLPAADRCGTCTACIDACPTDALIAPGELDSRRCIAYLTIEKRGAIPEEFREPIGRHVFGCDICQDVCPWNRKARRRHWPEPTEEMRDDLVNPALEWLAQMDQDGFRQLFRKSPVKRSKFAGLRRNLAIAMGNSGDPKFASTLEKWARDPDENVAEHAKWGLARLDRGLPRRDTETRSDKE
jgi:epoxyqueuosine reductase